ncbi:MAG: tautomerase family protein [Clostridiales bacterium]|nr:tautomerase family protein [Clostridiales bacterium]
MPNISVKMLAGRTQAQKEQLAKDLVEVLSRDLGASKYWITCTIEDYDAEQWQEVFKTEIADKPDSVVFKKPEYDPKDLL